jgi:hypothetical protein
MPSIVFQDGAAGGIELLFHQMPGEVGYMHLAAMLQQATRRLQPQ